MSKRFIVSPTRPPYPADEPEMRAMFGVTGGKWPKEGCKLRFIQGIAVHVLPADHASLTQFGLPGERKTKSRKHRVIAACPNCGVAVSAGRLQQHKCVTKYSRRNRKIDRAFQTAELKVARGREFPENHIDSQPLKQLGDEE